MLARFKNKNHLIRDNEDNKLINELYDKPQKERGSDMPHIQVFKSSFAQQADILFLPNDKGFKYCLVVVDNHTKLVDAVPLKTKATVEVVKAFKTIYEKHNILKMPQIIQVDPGSEFKKETESYFEDNKVIMKIGAVDRHRNQALAEYKNKTIGTNLFKYMSLQEIKTGKPYKKWVDILPELINKLNSKLPKPIEKPLKDDPYISKKNYDILPIGSSVRTALEAPIDNITKKRLHGSFRATDIKYKIKPEKITNFIIKDGYPILYNVNDRPIGYTRQQIKPVFV